MVGIITAADTAYFPGLYMLIRSLRYQSWPVCIFDLGLTRSQRNWCFDQGYEVRPGEYRLISPPTPMFRCWNKATYFQDSPFERSLWLDADCIAVNSLTPLLNWLAAKPLFIKHWSTSYQSPNDPRLYDAAALARPEPFINNGVMGLDKVRDAHILAAWVDCIERCRDDTIRSYLHWSDESAMIWALRSMAEPPGLCPYLQWNQFRHGIGSDGPDDLLIKLNPDQDDIVMHAAGNPKYWQIWGPLSY
jgi:hypothetical protein